MIDSFLLDLIKNNHYNVVYKVSASELYLSFKMYCSNNNNEIISNKKFGTIMKTYKVFIIIDMLKGIIQLSYLT